MAPSEVAAIVVEPIQGEGGFVPAPVEFIQGLRRICDEYGIVLVADEVQTGFGRTGAMFAIEHYGIEPDLIVVAKSLASGLPLSGVIGKAEIMDAAARGRDRRHLHRQPGCAGRGERRAGRDRGREPDRAGEGARRDDRGAHEGLAGSLRADRRRARRAARCWRSSW